MYQLVSQRQASITSLLMDFRLAKQFVKNSTHLTESNPGNQEMH